jgi:hypothetical protein
MRQEILTCADRTFDRFDKSKRQTAAAFRFPSANK